MPAILGIVMLLGVALHPAVDVDTANKKVSFNKDAIAVEAVYKFND